MIKFGTSSWLAAIADEFSPKGPAGKPAEGVDQFAGCRVASVNRFDEATFILEDGSWILMRPFGTEPMVRVYAEASSEQELEVLFESGRKYILG